jgi:hypothetical protein
MHHNEKTEHIKRLMKLFELPVRDYSAECMLVAEKLVLALYKDGAFIYDKKMSRLLMQSSGTWG